MKQADFDPKLADNATCILEDCACAQAGDLQLTGSLFSSPGYGINSGVAQSVGIS